MYQQRHDWDWKQSQLKPATTNQTIVGLKFSFIFKVQAQN